MLQEPLLMKNLTIQWIGPDILDRYWYSMAGSVDQRVLDPFR